MKKLIIAAIALCLTALCLVGCETQTTSEQTALEAEKDSHIYVWTDKETGVQYIIYSVGYGYAGMGGITPRLNADGTLYIEKESEDTE